MTIQPHQNPPLQAHSAQRRSCDALGLCQARQPACPGCHSGSLAGGRHNTHHLAHGQHWFAPGVIEGGPRRVLRRHRVRALVRLALWLAVALALVATVLLASYGLGHAWARFGHVAGVVL